MNNGLDIMKMLGTLFGPTIQSAITKNATQDKVGDYIAQQEARRDIGTIQNPDTAIVNNEISYAKAASKADSNVLANIFAGLGNVINTYGSRFTPTFENGGTMEGDNVVDNILKGLMRNDNPQGVSIENAPKPANVEGGEIIDRAKGGLEYVDGPSHAEGGVPTELLPTTSTQTGDVVYSEDLSKDGKSMAKRKIEREKQLKKLEAELKKNPTDTLLKQTIERLKMQIVKEEEQDIALQNAAQEIYSAQVPIQQEEQETVPEFATGGTYSKNSNEMIDLILQTFGNLNSSAQTKTTDLNSLGNSNADINAMKAVSSLTQQDIDKAKADKIDINTTNKTKNKDFKFNPDNIPTTGDLIGLFGNAMNTFSPLAIAQQQRSRDTANKNTSEGLTKAIDKRYEDTEALLRQQNALSAKDIDANFVSAMAANENVARSSAVKNALNTAAFVGGNTAKTENFKNLLSSLYNLKNSQTQTALASEQAERRGEAERIENDAKDRDNYFSRIQQALLDMGKGTATIGKNLNDIKSSNLDKSLLNSFSNYVGIDFNSGKIKYKNGKPVNPEMFEKLGTTEEAYNKMSKAEKDKLLQDYMNKILTK